VIIKKEVQARDVGVREFGLKKSDNFSFVDAFQEAISMT
jgi:hypothetical protein